MSDLFSELKRNVRSLSLRERRRLAFLLSSLALLLVLLILLRPHDVQTSPCGPGALLAGVSDDVLLPLARQLPADAENADTQNFTWITGRADGEVGGLLDGKPQQSRPKTVPVPSPSPSAKAVATDESPTPDAEPSEGPLVPMDLRPPPRPHLDDVLHRPHAPPPATDVTLQGSMSQPAGANHIIPLPNHPLHLIEMGTLQSTDAVTDSDGRFSIPHLKPGGLYYLVSMQHMRYIDGTRVEMQYGLGYNYHQPYMPGEVPNEVEKDLSWHQEVWVPDKPGVYRLDLSIDNADPEFCGDLVPTNDAVLRTPYRSWRPASLEPMNPPG
jgi:hypothetical protein